MHVLFYDENFKYDGEADIEINTEEGEELPPNCTTALIPAGLYDPKYDPKKAFGLSRRHKTISTV